MSFRMLFALVLGSTLLPGCSGGAEGDAARGASLHEACLSCHGTELYVPPKAKVQSLSDLKREVEKWSDHYNPKFTSQEVEDLVAYLDRDFYKFTR